MKKISVVISAYNESKKISDCIKSVKNIADEVIVVDCSSTDDTASIAKELGAKLYKQPNHLMLNINKNYGFSKASFDWILNLDADERLTPELTEEIETWKKSHNFDIVGYWIARKNIIFGKWIKSDMWWPDYVLRLFKKERGKFAEKHVHEYIEVDGKTDYFKTSLLHESYSSIAQYIYKLEHIYTENEVENMIVKGYALNPIDAIGFPIRDFIKTYLAQKGYKDGLHGLVLSMLQAFYSFIVFAKLWERQGFVEKNDDSLLNNLSNELNKLKREASYWILTQKINDKKGNKLLLRLVRKIKSL